MNNSDVSPVFPTFPRKPRISVVRDFPFGLKRCDILDFTTQTNIQFDVNFESDYDFQLLNNYSNLEAQEIEEAPEEEDEEQDDNSEILEGNTKEEHDYYINLDSLLSGEFGMSNFDVLFGKRAHSEVDSDEEEDYLKPWFCKRQKTTHKSESEVVDWKSEDLDIAESEFDGEFLDFDSEEENSSPGKPEYDDDLVFQDEEEVETEDSYSKMVSEFNYDPSPDESEVEDDDDDA